MAIVVTINRPDVVALITQAAERLTAGNKTEAVARAVKQMLDEEDRTRALFGAHPGTVLWVDPSLELTQPTFADYPLDAEAQPWGARLRKRRKAARAHRPGR